MGGRQTSRRERSGVREQGRESRSLVKPASPPFARPATRPARHPPRQHPRQRPRALACTSAMLRRRKNQVETSTSNGDRTNPSPRAPAPLPPPRPGPGPPGRQDTVRRTGAYGCSPRAEARRHGEGGRERGGGQGRGGRLEGGWGGSEARPVGSASDKGGRPGTDQAGTHGRTEGRGQTQGEKWELLAHSAELFLPQPLTSPNQGFVLSARDSLVPLALHLRAPPPSPARPPAARD